MVNLWNSWERSSWGYAIDKSHQTRKVPAAGSIAGYRGSRRSAEVLVLFLLFSHCLLAGYARDIRSSGSFDATQCVCSYVCVQCFAVNTVNFVSPVCLTLGMPSAVEPYPCNFLEQWIDELQLAKAKSKNGGDAAFPLLFPVVVAYPMVFWCWTISLKQQKKNLRGRGRAEQLSAG